MKRYLLMVKHAPYQSVDSLENYELALALAAFEQAVSLIFIGGGVLQLLSNQAPNLQKAFTKGYGALDIYGIEKVYLDKDSLADYELTPEALMIPTQLVTRQEIASLMVSHDIVLSL